MNAVSEVIFVTCINEEQLSCSAFDFKTSSNLMVYKKGGTAAKRTLNFIHNKYIITADTKGPLIRMWAAFSQEEISFGRFVTPGKTTALAISPDGNYLLAGVQETVYVWQLMSGKMLASASKHFQDITCIKFTEDGSHFVTAGSDGGILVWNLASFIGLGEENQAPLHSFNDHTLPLTDVHIGSGGIKSYLYTSSLDRTCKVYDLSSAELLLNVIFQEPLTCITTNVLETSIYVGTSNGVIYELFTHSLPRSKEHSFNESNVGKYCGHDGEVTCLALSIDGETLISGGKDGNLHLWHIPSKQLVRSIKQKGPVTNIALLVTPTSLFNPENAFSNIFNNKLKRMLDAPEADEQDTLEVFVTETPNDKLHMPHRTAPWELSTTNIAQVQKLQLELKQLKSINEGMYKVILGRLIKD